VIRVGEHTISGVGGELAVAVVFDAVARLRDRILHTPESAR